MASAAKAIAVATSRAGRHGSSWRRGRAGRGRLDRTRRPARLSSLRGPARSALLQRGRRRFRKQDRRTSRSQTRQVGRLHVLSRRHGLHPQHAERPPLRRRVGNCSRRRHRSTDQSLLSNELRRRVSQGRSAEGSGVLKRSASENGEDWHRRGHPASDLAGRKTDCSARSNPTRWSSIRASIRQPTK